MKKKQLISLTENQIHTIVKESLNRILTEIFDWQKDGFNPNYKDDSYIGSEDNIQFKDLGDKRGYMVKSLNGNMNDFDQIIALKGGGLKNIKIKRYGNGAELPELKKIVRDLSQFCGAPLFQVYHFLKTIR